jgi:hypothetical protein
VEAPVFARIDFNRVTTAVALILVAALATSCASTWKSQSKPPRELLQVQANGKQPPDKARVHDVAGNELVVYDPAIQGDSLVGRVDWERRTVVAADWSSPPTGRTIYSKRPVSIPLDSIRTVDLRGTSTPKTLAIWGVALGIYSAIIAATYEPMTMY